MYNTVCKGTDGVHYFISKIDFTYADKRHALYSFVGTEK